MACAVAATLRSEAAFAAAPQPPQKTTLSQYIDRTWEVLQREPKHLLQAAKSDSCPPHEGKYFVYVSPHENLERVRQEIRNVVPASDLRQLRIDTLPQDIAHHGLLYVPKPYVVPGGMFNEMYGWDSFFIGLGLAHAGRHSMVRNLTDNLLYEIDHYGHVLNANRTFSLSRSQPPLIAQMVRQVFNHDQDISWLKKAMPRLEAMYRFWTVGARQTATGLSRYYDDGDGPAPEVLLDKDSSGRTSYDRIKQVLRKNPSIDGFKTSLLYDAQTDDLTAFAYKSDRAMRESGFDLTDRFGPFGLATVRFNPVCLNSLLFVMEEDLAELPRVVGDGAAQAKYQDAAKQRRQRINSLLWDEAAGLYFDYDTETKARRPYPFLTTFMPLWAGIANKEQASRIVEKMPLFETPNGLQTSTHVSHAQWDAPYAWAPLQWFAVMGLRRYGYPDLAKRVAQEFTHVVQREFERSGHIYEKYNVEKENAESSGLLFGYTSNEVGFGWTNGVIADFMR